MRLAALAAGLAAGIAAVAGAEEPAPAARKPRIALEPLRAPGLSAALVAAVEDRLCAEIAGATGAEVVCPSDVAAAMAVAREAAFHGSCATDECLRRVDAMKDADRRVSGALERGDGVLVLSLQVVDRSGPGGRAVVKLPEDLDGLFSRLPDAVRKLLPRR